LGPTLKKKSDLAVGNIIGSNIFNLLMVLPLSGLIKPLDFNPAFHADIFLLLVGTVLLFIAMFTGRRRKLDRWESGIFVVGFVGYTLYLIAQEYPGIL
jgi:cation:H+ antiporter